jgi:probable phosphoglycerate mutase
MLPRHEFPEPAAEGSTRVYVMRHGQSTYNVEGRLQGCCDEPVLTTQGFATAEAAAALFRNAGLHAIVTSPLRRASQTALHIYSRIWRSLAEGPSFSLDAQLREIELPQWEGRSLEAIRNEFGKQYVVWREQPHLFRMPDGRQPVTALFARAERFWRHLLHGFAGKRVLVVTHGGTGRALISTALGIPKERFHRVQQSNGGITILNFARSDMRPQLSAVNLTDYLGEGLPKLKGGRTGLRMLLAPTGAADRVQLERAAEVLKNIPLSAVFADTFVNREVAARLLREGVNAGARVCMSAASPELNIPSESLATVLLVIREESLHGMLLDVLGLQQAQADLLSLAPFTFTVLHQPGAGEPAFLQAMNLHDAAAFAESIDRIAPAGPIELRGQCA